MVPSLSVGIATRALLTTPLGRFQKFIKSERIVLLKLDRSITTCPRTISPREPFVWNESAIEKQNINDTYSKYSPTLTFQISIFLHPSAGGHPSKTTDQKLTFWSNIVLSNIVRLADTPPPISDVRTVSSVKTSETQNILRSGKIYCDPRGAGGVSDSNTDYWKTNKKFFVANFFFLDVRLMADPPAPPSEVVHFPLSTERLWWMVPNYARQAYTWIWWDLY